MPEPTLPCDICGDLATDSWCCGNLWHHADCRDDCEECEADYHDAQLLDARRDHPMLTDLARGDAGCGDT